MDKRSLFGIFNVKKKEITFVIVINIGDVEAKFLRVTFTITNLT